MKKNKGRKEVTKLRAEIEILKARLKEGSGLPSESLKLPELKDTVSKQSQNPKIPQSIKTETMTLPQLSYLKSDLTKTFVLSLISMFFILSLKFVILPQQKLISQSVVNVLQSAASTLGKIKR